MSTIDHMDDDRDRVLNYPEFAKLASVSVATLRRLIAAGDGPVVTHLSHRRVGIRLSHGRSWLDSRAIEQQKN